MRLDTVHGSLSTMTIDSSGFTEYNDLNHSSWFTEYNDIESSWFTEYNGHRQFRVH